jgi:lysophospholipase L1-like esterase
MEQPIPAESRGDRQQCGAGLAALTTMLDVMILSTLIAAPVVWMGSPLQMFGDRIVILWRAWFVVIPMGLGIARAIVTPLLRSPGLWRFVAAKRLALAIGATFIFFLAIEQVLQLVGFEYELPPMVVRGDAAALPATKEGYPFIQDPELLWRYKPSFFWHGRSTSEDGFFSRSVSVAKEEGTIRVLCLGDSCTAQGEPPYPGILHETLTSKPPTKEKWEAFNMAVHGYSSAQGLRLFETAGMAYRPDVVTLYFGWNDHWLSPGEPDHIQMAIHGPGPLSGVYNVLRGKRFGQLLIKLIGRHASQQASSDALEYRVPTTNYRANLERFAAMCRQIGAIPVFITAPRARTLSRALVHSSQARSIEQAISVHDEYNEITRQVAKDIGVPLLDLAEIFAAPEWGKHFSKDGIHFYDSGRQEISDKIYDRIIELVNSSSWGSRAGNDLDKGLLGPGSAN